MTVQAELQSSLKLEEDRTAGDSFGGDPLGGRSPAFRITDVTDSFLAKADIVHVHRRFSRLAVVSIPACDDRSRKSRL